MHYIAPIPILVGCIGALFGFLWLVSVGSEEDGGPSPGLFFLIGKFYLIFRVLKNLFTDPMSVLPAFGILAVSAGLIWLGVAML
jgi:hypothetical protein